MLPFSLNETIKKEDGSLFITESVFDDKFSDNIVVKEYQRDKDNKIVRFNRLEGPPAKFYNAICTDLKEKLSSVNTLITYDEKSSRIASYSDYSVLYINREDKEGNELKIEIKLHKEIKGFRKLQYLLDSKERLHVVCIYIENEYLLQYKELMDLLV